MGNNNQKFDFNKIPPWAWIIAVVAMFVIVTNLVPDKQQGTTYTSYDSKKDSYKSKPHKLMDWPISIKEGSNEEIAKDLTQKNFYVVMDNSGSMGDRKCSGNETKEQVAKRALKNFSLKVSKDANLGLLAFDYYGISERVSLGINNRDKFALHVNKSAAGGTTPLKTAMKLGVAKLATQAGRQLGYGEYNLVVITDGEANSGEEPEPVVNYVLEHTPVIIHTIGFCISHAHSLNQPDKVLYKGANKPEELFKGLEEVLAEAETFDVSDFKGEL